MTARLVLQNEGLDDLTITVDGSFTFATAIADGSAYSVTVLTQPGGQTCDVTNGRGPDWSPDGTTIVFHSDRTGDFEIWTYELP